MSYNITSTNTGVVLSNGTTQNPSTVGTGVYVTNTTASHGGDAIYGSATYAWTISNYGTVRSNPTAGDGIDLRGGGVVTNLDSAVSTAVLTGYVNGVFITGGSGTVSNSGMIASTGAGSTAINLQSGGYVANGAGGSISGGAGGVLVSTSAGTVNNFGSIGAAGGNGVYLTGGGLVVNQAGGGVGGIALPRPPGVISGYDGVRIAGAAGTGTLLNGGNIVSTGTGFGAQGVDFLAGGTLYNYGAILGTNTDASGVNAGFADDTIINGATNNASATIAGYLNGVDQFSSSGTVINFASITSSNGAGVDLQQGGTVDNRGGGLINGSSNGVQVGGSAGTVVNRGSITATGTAFPTAIYIGAGGSIDNFGMVSATGSNSGIGANFAHGGMLTNESGGLITGSSVGVVISGTYGSLNNLGTIVGVNDGVVLKATGANLTNSGLISDGDIAGAGLYLYAGGNATNAASGVIQGYHGILSTHTAANIVNLGTIASLDAADGVTFAVAGSTLRNAGMITGNSGYGVRFTGSNNRLIVDPGAVFSGARAAYGGGGGNDVLEFAAGTTGTLGVSQYTGFDTTQIDAGASWAVAGNYTIPAGGTLLDFGTLTNLGTLLGNGAHLIVDPGTFVNSGYVNTTVTLDGGSYLDNTSTGTISVAGTAVLGLNSPNTVVNAGTILGSGTSGVGVDLLAGGTVTNQAGGTIEGSQAINIAGAAGEVTNAGLLSADGEPTVDIGSGGTVTNSGTIENSGTNDAVLFSNAAGSVFNSGTIVGGTGTPAPAAPGNVETVFDTTPSWNGTSFIQPFGAPDTATYGQTFVAPIDNVLQSFTFYLKGSATLQFQAEVYAWSGNLLGGSGPQGATGPALFTSSPITVGPTGGVFQPVTVNTGGVTLTQGGHYIALFTISGPDPTDFANSTGTDVWGDIPLPHVANDGGGGFNFDNNGSSFAALTGSSWDDFSDFGDSAWTATFTSPAAGVGLAAGGRVSNAAAGLIEGGIGVSVGAAAGTVDNSGMITGTGIAGIGVELRAGGSVSNAATGTISGSDDGVLVTGAAGTVGNSGTIQALGSIVNGSGSIVAGNAINLAADGSVGNGTAGLIEGYHIGVLTGAVGPATVVNLGTIESLQTSGNGFTGAGVQLDAGGSVSNSGLISGQNGVSFIATGGPGIVANFGTIASSSSGTSGIGVFLGAGGTLRNSGTITAANASNGAAVQFGAAGGTLVNRSGGVISAYHVGVGFFPGTAANPGTLSLVNHGTIVSTQQSTAASTGFSGFGVQTGQAGAFGGVAAIDNLGTIAAAETNGGGGVRMRGGGLLTNEGGGLITGAALGVDVIDRAGTVVNFGSIVSTAAGTVGEAVFLGAGGSVVNHGLITGARPSFAVGTLTSFAGVVTTATVGATVDNFGTISSDSNSNDGVNLLHGGVVVNRAGALILGSHTGIYGGGHIAGGALYSYPGAVTTVVNYGTIANASSAGSDVRIVADGTVINHGLIDSPRTGISFGSAGGTVDNFGTVRSTAATSFTAGSGIYLQSGGLITNEAGGLVTAQRAAISLGTSSAAATIANLGILTGNTGVSINAADSGNNTIDNFGTIVGTGGTAISLGSGADLVILEAGSVLSGAIAGFVPGDTLDLMAVPFSTSDTVTFDGTTLTVSGGGVSQSVQLAGIAAGTDFILESDAQGEAQIVPVSSGSNLVVSSGQILTVLMGQNVSNVTVLSGGVLDVASGGVASGAVILSGGVESVFAGGTDSGATVSSGGFEDVFGSAVATLVLNGGSQTVEAGGTASAVVLDGVGLQTVSGFAGSTVVGSGDEELVASGGVASGSVISSGGSEVVLSGGLTSDTVIAGGILELEAGATANGLVTFNGSGGDLQLDSLGTPAAAVAGLVPGDVIDFRAVPFAISDTVAFDGTTLTVSGGGVSQSVSLTGLAASTVFLLRSDGNGGSDLGPVPASGAVVSAGEVLHVSAGETLTNVTVLSGGVLEVDAGGTAIGTMVSSGGEELVEPGGTDSAAVISSGGFEDVFGNAGATLVLNGGSQTVEAGGRVTGAVLDGVGLQTVSGVAIGTVVSAGDEQLVASGGVAIGTTVLSGGLLVVASGGVASGAVISSGGEAVVSAGGVDRGAVIASGGEAVVSGGGVEQGAVVSGGGVEEVFGNAGGTVVLSGGQQLVEPGGVASGTVISQGGFEQVLGGVTSDTTIAGGKLEVTTGAVAEGVIGFAGVAGTLQLDSLATPAATLEGVVAGDVIDLSLLSFAASDTVTLGQTNLLTVSGGGRSVSLQFDASAAGKGFALSDDGSGGTLVTLTSQVPQARLFDFVFIYNGGQDYYLGRVADDGRFGVAVGETKTNAAGSYIIFGEESGASSAAAGSVFVDYYSHGGPGASSGVPVKTAAGSADGNAGLGSESDTLVGLDGAGHAFSSTQPAAFATTALFGFVFTYADGAAYSGTVADNTPGGLPGSRTVTDASGNVLGVYTIFRDGVTSRPAGSVVIDRFVANGIAVLANHASNTAVDGRNGLGSEVGSVTVGSVDHAFGPRAEPVVTGNAPTEPASSTPPLSDVIANEVDRIFADILGRFPTQGEFDTAGGELGQGTSPGDLRAALAGGSEASGDVAGLYRQVFGRAATTGEIAGATGALANGGSLAGLQQQLANSAEASGDINQVYRDILGRDADPSGLASFVAALGDETPGHLTDPGGLAGLAGVRDVLAHSGQAEDALTSLFQTIIGRAPSTAELAGMEDRLVAAGTTEATLKSALRATGSAGGFTTITAPGGNASLAAPSGPSLFQFSDIAFNDTITGFDARRDTIQLPKTVAADFPTVQGDTTAAGGGSLITLNQNQSIFLAGLPPAKLAAGNFLLL